MHHVRRAGGAVDGPIREPLIRDYVLLVEASVCTCTHVLECKHHGILSTAGAVAPQDGVQEGLWRQKGGPQRASPQRALKGWDERMCEWKHDAVPVAVEIAAVTCGHAENAEAQRRYQRDVTAVACIGTLRCRPSPRGS